MVLVVASLGFFLFGAMGLAIDGAQLYAQRQMAQSAADAAAQAGMVTIFDGSIPAIGTSAYYCTSSNTTSPCTYVSKNGYTAGACSSPSSAAPGADCIYVNPNPGVSVCQGATGCTLENELQVTITRAVPMTLMKTLGINSLNVTAQATAAIVDVTSRVPIVITHPSMSPSFSLGGSGSITICGGPQRSIQVNSSSPTSLSGTGVTVDLSKAGPADSGNCTTGTGGDFGDFGGPPSQSFLSPFGSTEHYIQPADPILDPLASVPTPTRPTTQALPPKMVLNGQYGCPAATCVLYYPGLYITSGIGTVGPQTVLFSPGIYYLDSSMGPAGFNVGTGGVAMMATGVPADPVTGTGMLVYLTNSTTPGGCSAAQTGTISITGNALVNLSGTPSNSVYQGILFFVDHSAATAVHTLGQSGGNITINGTIYATDSLSLMGTCDQFQKLQLGGNSVITGEIIASVLETTGSATIQVSLYPNAVPTVRQIALVNGE